MDNDMEGSRNRMEGKQAKRVKQINETTETGKAIGRSFRGKKAKLKNFNLTWLAVEKKESVF